MYSKWTLILSLALGLVHFSECGIGDGCSKYLDCGHFSSEECLNGICHCKEDGSLEFNKNTLTPTCGRVMFDFFTFGRCPHKACPDNSTCLDNGRCKCDEGFIKIDSKCIKENPQKVLAPCSVSPRGDVKSCDFAGHSLCKSGRCICFQKYYLSNDSGTCKPESSYIKSHGLTEYRVKPGVYCRDSSQCISGLVCKNYACSCPSHCSYNAKRESCDCGNAAVPLAPLLLGILLGLLIVWFWCWRIKKTIESFDKRSAQFSTIMPDHDESTTHTSYPLSPVHSPSPALSHATDATSVPPVGLTTNSPLDLGRQSPMSPMKKTDLNPPPYSEVVAEPPPPYTLNPPMITGSSPSNPNSSAPLEPGNSTPMPTAPNPSSLSATPYPLNPSASSYPLATPYPSAPGVAPSAPTLDTGNSTTPPTYNSGYGVINP